MYMGVIAELLLPFSKDKWIFAVAQLVEVKSFNRAKGRVFCFLQSINNLLTRDSTLPDVFAKAQAICQRLEQSSMTPIARKMQ